MSINNTELARTVLVVEDDADSRVLLQLALQNEDLNVVLKSHARDALDYLENQFLPDLVLLDISMPDLDGETFLKLVRSNSKLKDLKILFVSGWDDLAQRAKACGANGYIRKPIHLNNLLKEISKYISR